jgi:hypothetical protein
MKPKKPNRLLEFIETMRRNPWQSKGVYASLMNCSTRLIDKWITEVEVEFKKGRDPITGHGGVRLWNIKLPQEKVEAIKVN